MLLETKKVGGRYKQLSKSNQEYTTITSTSSESILFVKWFLLCYGHDKL